MGTRAGRGFGQYSGVARAVERVGERWALLIIRDLLAGARRYSDLKAGLPRIPTNILSDRLKELQQAGVIRRVPTVRGGYELTLRGRDLEPVIVELERWGWSVLGEPADDEIVTHDATAVALRAAFKSAAASGAPPAEYVLHVGGISMAAMVADGRLDVVPLGPDALPQPRMGASTEVAVDTSTEVDLDTRAEVALDQRLEFEVTPVEFRDLIAGVLHPGAVRLLSGERTTLEQFVRTFRIDTCDPPAKVLHD